jgi:hypothetical protein
MRTNGTSYEKHDLLCQACTVILLVDSAKGRIFNSVLYARYVHLSKVKHIRKR